MSDDDPDVTSDEGSDWAPAAAFGPATASVSTARKTGSQILILPRFPPLSARFGRARSMF